MELGGASIKRQGKPLLSRVKTAEIEEREAGWAGGRGAASPRWISWQAMAVTEGVPKRNTRLRDAITTKANGTTSQYAIICPSSGRQRQTLLLHPPWLECQSSCPVGNASQPAFASAFLFLILTPGRRRRRGGAPAGLPCCKRRSPREFFYPPGLSALQRQHVPPPAATCAKDDGRPRK